MSLQTKADDIPQVFWLGTGATTIRTAAVTQAVRCSASRDGQWVTLELEPNLGSGVNLAVGSFDLTPDLSSSYWPAHALSFGYNITTAVATAGVGSVGIATDGTITITGAFTAATYNPTPYTISLKYSAI